MVNIRTRMLPAKWNTALLAMGLSALIGQNLLSQTAQLPPSTKEPPSSATDEAPRYDVVSIRPVDMTKDTSGWGLAFDPGKFKGYQVTASMLIWAATGITDLHRIKGLPDWASKIKYTIDAKVTGDEAKSLSLDRQTKQALLLSILTSRFHYSGHYERAESPVLALVVANGGVKHMTPHIPGTKPTSPRSCWSGKSRPGYIKAEGCRMADLVANLDVIDDRQVLNQTDLTDRYDFELRFDNTATSFLVNGWTTPVTHDPNAEWPSIYEALQEQLGLKLKPTKAELPVLVVDHLEFPTEN